MSKILINGNQLEFLTEHILLNEQTQADLEGDTKRVVNLMNFFLQRPTPHLKLILKLETMRKKNLKVYILNTEDQIPYRLR